METASDDASPIPVRQFRRRKSIGELVHGIKLKYSREKMIKDSDVDSRNLVRADTNASAVASSGPQSLLIQNPSQNRYSLPIPIPERSASIPYECLPVSPVSSAPPRLDALPDFALDGFKKASIFGDGFEKAVNDISTQQGDSTKTVITSTSPTTSIAVRDKNITRPRCMVPIYADIPNPRVIGELWTTLESQAKPSRPLPESPKEHTDTASPFHDSHKTDGEYDESEKASTSTSTKQTAPDGVSTSTSLPAGRELQENLPPAKTTDNPEVNPNKIDSQPSNIVSSDSGANADINSPDNSDSSSTGAATPLESANGDSLCSQDHVSMSALSQSTPRDQSSSVIKDGGNNEADLEDPPRPTAANRGRNSSAPSVAALVSKFRRMEQSPENGPRADGAQEQDQVSVESNSRFIQSYRQRSDDSDNENSLLSTVSSDNAGDGRPHLVVY